MMTSHQSASTLEEIERRHIGGYSSTNDNNEYRSEPGGNAHHIFTCGEPESPNTLLRRTLNIAPLPGKPDVHLQRKTSHQSPSVTSSGFADAQSSVATVGIPLFRTEAAERDSLMDSVAQKSAKDRVQTAHSVSPDCLITPQALVQGLVAKVMR